MCWHTQVEPVQLHFSKRFTTKIQKTSVISHLEKIMVISSRDFQMKYKSMEATYKKGTLSATGICPSLDPTRVRDVKILYLVVWAPPFFQSNPSWWLQRWAVDLSPLGTQVSVERTQRGQWDEKKMFVCCCLNYFNTCSSIGIRDLTEGTFSHFGHNFKPIPEDVFNQYTTSNHRSAIAYKESIPWTWKEILLSESR